MSLQLVQDHDEVLGEDLIGLAELGSKVFVRHVKVRSVVLLTYTYALQIGRGKHSGEDGLNEVGVGAEERRPLALRVPIEIRLVLECGQIIIGPAVRSLLYIPGPWVGGDRS